MGTVKLKIMGISCNHRKARNTAWLTLYALKAAEKFARRISEIAEIETEFVELGDKKKKISTTAFCKRADGRYVCSENDYITEELLPKMMEADGFIFGSPVFTGSYTSKFITLFEHLRGSIHTGGFTDKPAGCVSVATMPTGGQDRCLESMDMCVRAVGMIPVHALFGCAGISGVPYGPLSGDDDGTVIAVKKDRFAQWSAILTGRRVAEVAVMKGLAKRRLNHLYESEFIRKYSLPFGEESWAWTDLDDEDRAAMMRLDRNAIRNLDSTVESQATRRGEKAVSCKIIGLGCDDSRGVDTNWLIVNSLKAVQKFGRRVSSAAHMETEFIDLAAKHVRPCLNCDHYHDIPNGGRRWKGEKYPETDSFGCIIKNDDFAKAILTKYAEADGVIFGSSVCTLSPGITFRLFAERLVTGIWKGWNNLKPTANIAVSYDGEGGQETCLSVMNNCNRWIECIPVSWPHGTPAKGGVPDGNGVHVKDDPSAVSLSVINGRRVAEFALMNRLAKQELGDIYKREFYHVIHPPHGDAGWEWSRLDREEDDAMMNMSPAQLAELGR